MPATRADHVHNGETASAAGSIVADDPTAAHVAKVRQTRPVGVDAALLLAIAGMVLFQNTPAQYHGRPELAEQHTAELRPLVSAAVPAVEN